MQFRGRDIFSPLFMKDNTVKRLVSDLLDLINSDRSGQHVECIFAEEDSGQMRSEIFDTH